MRTQIYLIAPADAQTAAFSAQLAAALDRHDVSALVLPRGARAENAYKEFAKAIIPQAQAKGCAVLVEGAPGLVRLLGADGLHVTDGADAARDAVKALHPNHIVGVGNVHSRDDAMTLGELEVDYVLFGSLTAPATQVDRDMAAWWAETMEIPAVLADPAAEITAFDAAGCEFIGLAVPTLETAK